MFLPKSPVRWVGLWALPGVLFGGLWLYGAVAGPVQAQRQALTGHGTYNRTSVVLMFNRLDMTHRWPGSRFPLSAQRPADTQWSFRRLNRHVEQLAFFHRPGDPPPPVPAVVRSPWALQRHGLGFSFSRYYGHLRITVPLPLLVGVFATPWLISQWRRSKTKGPDTACPDCGYNVRGLPAGCPECGWSRSAGGTPSNSS